MKTRKMLMLLVVLALGLPFFASCTHVTGERAGETFDDSVITGTIKGKILKDSELKTLAISVNTFQGNVTLSGQVPNLAAEERAIRYAYETKGVKSVSTNLKLAEVSQGSSAGQTMSSPGNTSR
jgi:hypothetical protein